MTEGVWRYSWVWTLSQSPDLHDVPTMPSETRKVKCGVPETAGEYDRKQPNSVYELAYISQLPSQTGLKNLAA
jgi:hypothetical protein